jgi:hypothetical protein
MMVEVNLIILGDIIIQLILELQIHLGLHQVGKLECLLVIVDGVINNKLKG